MALYRVEPTPQDTVDVFSAAHEPARTIASGDTIMVRTLDAAGYLERQEFPGDTAKPKMFGGDLRGHCLNRPVAVRGAVPGDMLKVEIVSLTPACRERIRAGRAAREDWLFRAIEAKLDGEQRETLAAAIAVLKRLADD